MPILFKGKSTHYHGSSHAHLPHSPSNLRMGDDATGGMSVSGSGSRLPHAHSTTSSSGGASRLRLHRNSLRRVAASISSERTGHWLRRQANDALRHVRDPHLWLPLFKKYYRKWHLKHLLPLFFVMVYMLVGAIIFFSLESAPENKRLARRGQRLKQERVLFMKRMDEIFNDQAAVTQPSLRKKFFEEALDHFHHQMQVQIVEEPKWSLTTAMYFSGTIFTTIGYGDVVCETVWGRVVTVIYAIVGIPIMLITLNHLGKFLYKWINAVVAFYNRLVDQVMEQCCCRLSRKHKHSQLVNDHDDLDGVLESTALVRQQQQPSSEANHGNGIPVTILTTPSSGATQPDGEERRVSFVLHPEEEEDLSLNLDVTTDPIDAQKLQSASPPPLPLPFARQQPHITVTQSGGDWNDSGGKTDPVNLELGQSLDVTTGEFENEDLDEGEDLFADEEEEMPRMPVSVALACTIGWIFVCAALFKMWETEWTYAESCYFMFISLSTIGLGDVNVKRRDLMVVCFIFVIVGLSLVSMCINVIQQALEDLYRKLLMKILMDYQAKLAQGCDPHSASMGMMKMWGNSKTAKYLMPMLSNDTRRAVMQKIQGDAKETGISIPPIFEDIDDKTGMPKILAAAASVSDAADDPERQSAILSELVRQCEASASLAHFQSATLFTAAMNAETQSDDLPPPTAVERPPTPPPTVVLYENDTQTERVFFDDKNAQTSVVQFDDLAVQTDDQNADGGDADAALWRQPKLSSASAAIQTDADSGVELSDDGTQTSIALARAPDVDKETQTPAAPEAVDEETMTVPLAVLDVTDAETMTVVASLMNLDVQTDKVFTTDEQLQTHLIDLQSSTVQTNERETGEDYAQTEAPDLADAETQTEKPDPNAKGISKIRQARRRLERAFSSRGGSSTARRVSYGDRPALSNWRDHLSEERHYGDDDNDEISEEDAEAAANEEAGSSYESLNWDPIDGMHAEKQKPVKDLKRIFDRASCNRASLNAPVSAAMGAGFAVSALPRKSLPQQQEEQPRWRGGADAPSTSSGGPATRGRRGAGPS